MCADVFPPEPLDEEDGEGEEGGAAGAGGVRARVLEDEASRHPEPAVDAVRAQKACVHRGKGRCGWRVAAWC